MRRSRANAVVALCAAGCGVFVSSLARATEQLQCPPSQHVTTPPGAVILLASLLLAAAPLLLCLGVAAVYSRMRQGPADPGGGEHAVARPTWPTLALLVVGVLGSGATSLLSLLLLVSGAWRRCQ
jgi:hypothetical protein